MVDVLRIYFSYAFQKTEGRRIWTRYVCSRYELNCVERKKRFFAYKYFWIGLFNKEFHPFILLRMSARHDARKEDNDKREKVITICRRANGDFFNETKFLLFYFFAFLLRTQQKVVTIVAFDPSQRTTKKRVCFLSLDNNHTQRRALNIISFNAPLILSVSFSVGWIRK